MWFSLVTEFRRVLLDGYPTQVTRHGDVLVSGDGREVGIDEAIHLPPTEPSKIIAVHLNYASRSPHSTRTKVMLCALKAANG